MKIKCPNCGSIFEGPVSFCPSCGTKLAMPKPAQQPVQPAPQTYTQPAAPQPAPVTGSKGKAIGFGITSILMSIAAVAIYVMIVLVSVVIFNLGTTWEGTDFEAAVYGVSMIGGPFILGFIAFVPALLSFIFGLIAGKQKVVKGLGVTAKVIGILVFIGFFLFLIVGAVASIGTWVGLFGPIGAAIIDGTDFIVLF